MSQGTNIGGLDTQTLFNRVLRVAQLDTTVFDEVRDDQSATVPGIIVAVVSIFIAGLGGLLWWIVQDIPDAGEFFLESTILGSAFGVALWFAWVGVAYFVLTQAFRASADFQTLIRTMGLAGVPLALMFLMFIPEVGFGVGLTAVGLWVAASSRAVQVATNATPGQALLATGAGFLVLAAVLSLLAGADNTLAPGIFIFGAFD